MSEIGAEVQPHKFYTVKEVAKRFRFSTDTIRRIFGKEPDVLILPSKRRGCVYNTMRIPESAVHRVQKQLTVQFNDK